MRQRYGQTMRHEATRAPRPCETCGAKSDLIVSTCGSASCNVVFDTSNRGHVLCLECRDHLLVLRVRVMGDKPRPPSALVQCPNSLNDDDRCLLALRGSA